jgi:hypothetical protein
VTFQKLPAEVLYRTHPNKPSSQADLRSYQASVLLDMSFLLEEGSIEACVS